MENFFDNLKLLELVIISFIFMSFIFDLRVKGYTVILEKLEASHSKREKGLKPT